MVVVAEHASTWARVRDPQVQQAARKAARERRIGQVRPGWWIYSHDPEAFGMAGWGLVTATSSTRDPGRSGRVTVTVTVRSSLNGRPGVIEALASEQAWCCTRAEARAAGLEPA